MKSIWLNGQCISVTDEVYEIYKRVTVKSNILQMI